MEVPKKKSKICIVLPCNIFIAPFYKHYETLLNENNCEFDLIYWNRTNTKELTHAKNTFEYKAKDHLNSKSPIKILYYVLFSLFTKNMIRKNKYDKIIFLGSYGMIIALLSMYLKKKFPERYWLDIRDYTFEMNKIYYNLMKKAIKSAAVTAISSPAYKEFLPSSEYLYVHNFSDDVILHNYKKRDKDIIRISFIGLVRYYKQNEKLLLALKNDERFVIQYFGKNSEYLRKFCSENGINNVEFNGEFDPKQTNRFYLKTDIINNIYGNESIGERTAISNKFYYSLFNDIPILVSNNTYMEQLVEDINIGMGIDLESEILGDKIYNWYKSIEYKKNTKAEVYRTKVLRDKKEFKISMINFIND